MIDRAEPADDLPAVSPWEARVLAAANAYAEALAAYTPAGPDGVSPAFLTEHDLATNRIAAGRAAVLGSWDSLGAWASDGARSGASWLAAHTEQARPAAAAELHLARALRAMPLTAKHFADGTLGVAKVRLLAEAAREAAEPFTAQESFLTGEVQRLTVADAARFLTAWRARANPDGAQDRAAKQHDERSVHLSQTFGGMWRLDGALEPEAGEILRNELDRRCRLLYKAQKAEAAAAGERLAITPAQRRADALFELALQATAAGDDGGTINVPALTAIIDVDTLADPATQPTDVVGETEAGEPVLAETALRWACDCHHSRVVLGPDSVPVDLGRTARLPSPAQRRALAVRDRGCTFPGCDRPPGWTSAHHLVHWIRGGATDLWNQALLCVFHHHRVHEGATAWSASPTVSSGSPAPTAASSPSPKAAGTLQPERCRHGGDRPLEPHRSSVRP